MYNKFRNIVLTVTAIGAFAAPVLADTVACTVKVPVIRVRKSPSKKSQIVAVLKRNTHIALVDKSAGGWVKILSEDGRVTGYVPGWSISALVPKEVPATPDTQAKPDVSKSEIETPVTAQMDVPSNDKLAIQITELRLNVIGIERDMETMKKEIKKIKVAVGRKKNKKNKNAHVLKGRRHQAKKTS